ncbi:MAG: YggS family pyridoxal phosphate-dependent enzyme [Acidobacteriota bacterium]|nr:YggS family pyridoxal phosphate-dependent enzyme [Acidobacteriota bacterium]
MNANHLNPIGQNIRKIEERIICAAESCGRRPEEITLLAVSKTFPREAVVEAMRSGIRQFGENRVQEAEGKIPFFPPPEKPEWHLIGHLQSNKARRAVELFDVLQSVDSLKLATRISQAAEELGKVTTVLLQADLAGEATKFGAPPEEVRAILAAASELKGIRIDGLMLIPPYLEDPEAVRPYFRRLRELGETLEAEQPGCLGKRHLSMGMSHDFETAIREGATIVRVGTAIFGTR